MRSFDEKYDEICDKDLSFMLRRIIVALSLSRLGATKIALPNTTGIMSKEKKAPNTFRDGEGIELIIYRTGPECKRPH